MKGKLKGLKDRLTPRRSDSEASVAVETGRDALGLKELVPGHNPIVDIVAVHGLNGHREKSWTDDKSGILWLRDLLPLQLPNVRVLTFGYDADTLRLSNVSQLSLSDHARSFVAELLRVRRDPETERRPIIFLTHSLGGILVKNALVTCNSSTADHLERRKSIKLSTYGVMFFGTPHIGANGVEFQAALTNICRIFVSGNSKLLGHLTRDSDHLRFLSELYLPISQDFKTIFIYEEYKTPLVGGMSILIVPAASAVVPGTIDADAIPLHKHHINMVKFSSANDLAFQTVLSCITSMVQVAVLKVNHNWERGIEIKKLDDQKTANFSLTFDLPAQNLHFTGRVKELRLLSDIVQGTGKNQCKVAVLHGLGGIGKTDIVLQYAWQNRASYTSIQWIHAATAEVLKGSFMSVAQNLIQHMAACYHPGQPDYMGIACALGIAGLINSSGQLIHNAESDDQERIVGVLSKWLSMKGNDQ